MQKINNKKYILTGAILAIAFGALISIPAEAQAAKNIQTSNPTCVVGCNGNKKVVIKKSNINVISGNLASPGSTATTPGYTSNPVYSPTPVTTTPVYNNYSYNYSNSNYDPYPVYSTPVYSYGSTYSYYPNYPIYESAYYNSALYVSCYSAAGSVSVGDAVSWYASVSGGNGSYSYNWTGTDNLYGYNSYITKGYYTPGIKNASVTVTSGGQSISSNCDSSVNVYGNAYYNDYPAYQAYPQTYNAYPYPVTTAYPTAYQPTANTLDVACYADPASVSINQPTTWTAEATGGYAPYTYSWTGSDSLNGSDRSILKYYGTSGTKSAVVTIRSADGTSGTKACSNAVTVRKAASTAVKAAPTKPVSETVVQPETNQNNNDLSTPSLFSLKNVPWGWVAILIMLILFFTVVYLLFNRTKI